MKVREFMEVIADADQQPVMLVEPGKKEDECVTWDYGCLTAEMPWMAEREIDHVSALSVDCRDRACLEIHLKEAQTLTTWCLCESDGLQFWMNSRPVIATLVSKKTVFV